MSGRARQLAAAAAAGVVFGVGLAISGMAQPSKVIGFLDLFGAWDASLMFVMVGAITTHFVAYRVIMARQSVPLYDDRFHLPTRKDVDVRLVLGAAIFGVGWGLGGFCPGPALVAAGSGALAALVFVAGMSLGTKLEAGLSSRKP
jgi:uncharacterized protein